MLDLFYQGTFDEKIKKFRLDLKSYGLKNGIKFPKKFYIAYGNKTIVGNCILFITPPDSSAPLFNSTNDKELMSLAEKFGITNYFITRANIFPKDRYSRDDIKSFSGWMDILIDILDPKFIVVLGQEPVYLFSKRKIILEDNHGTFLSKEPIPIFLTYDISYYLTHSAYEDKSYKDFIQNNDWNIIKQEYGKLIC